MKTKKTAGPTCRLDMPTAKRAIAAAASAVPSRAVQPIWHTLHIGGFAVTGSDGETRLTMSCPGLDMPPVCIQAGRLTAILAAARGDEMEIGTDGTRATITIGSGRWTLPTEDAATYPTWEPANLKPIGRVPADQLRRAIKAVLYAADTESSRYALGALCLEVKDGTLHVVATDGRRMSAVEIELEQAVDDSQTLVPSHAAKLLERLLPAEGAIQIEANGTECVFSCGDDGWTLAARLVAGRYPRWRDVLVEREGTPHVVSPAALCVAVRQAAIVTSETSKGVACYFTKGGISLTARSAEAGESVTECEAIGIGDVANVTLDPRYLLEFAGSLGAESADIEILAGKPDEAVLLRSDDVRGVIMPMAGDA